MSYFGEIFDMNLIDKLEKLFPKTNDNDLNKIVNKKAKYKNELCDN